MSARSIAREIAVIILPQLPKDKSRLEKQEFDLLICKAVQMLTDYAKQCLSEANGFVLRAQEQLVEMELSHEDNAYETSKLNSVPLDTQQLKSQLELMEISMHLISEALDIPEMAMATDSTSIQFSCNKCGHLQDSLLKRPTTAEVKSFVQRLLSNYLDHRVEVDELIKAIKTKWRIERMVSIDRDILRLACAEAFYMPDIPINVVISEAVELCHRFADDRAAKFINGVLSDLNSQAHHFRQTGELIAVAKEVDGSAESSAADASGSPVL